MATYAGRWDCASCGTRGIYGPETRCPSCGASRPADVRFYLPTDAEAIADEKHQAAARAGVDWICGHCGTQNKALQTRCLACDHPRDDSSDDVDLSEREYALEALPTDSFAPKRTLHPDERPRPKPRRRRGSILLLLLLLLGGGWMALRSFPQQIDVEVVGFTWERQIQLLHQEVVQKEAWSAPGDALDVESFRAIRSYQEVLRGYETRIRNVKVKVGTERYVCGKIDKGNGYFVDKYCTRPIYENREETYEAPIYDKVPVYDTKYRFKRREWVAHQEHIVRATGRDQQARWPQDARLSQPDQWKAGPQRATYRLTVREPNGTQHVEAISYDRWQSLTPGQKIPAKRAYLFGTWYGLE
jgi:hypothetical protein